jgi:2-keto-4-pentenoate hydratase/2-oxohepta-3-ene-1,7-dioic acid hydratase in catechol pathway
MKIARIKSVGADGTEARIVVGSSVAPGRWVDVRTCTRLHLERRGASHSTAQRIAQTLVPGSLSAALEAGDTFMDSLYGAASDSSGDAFAPEVVELLAPIDPSLYRDFLSFEMHFTNAARMNNHAAAPVLYEMPISYMGNAHSFIGPEDTMPYPRYAKERMDYELELGIVIKRGGRDIQPENAMEHVLGLTILNDFSARDIQLREMQGRLGPSKGKHFCSGVGPIIVTLDELEPKNLEMTAKINGEVWSSGNSGTMLWSLEELVAWDSCGEVLPAGALLGSGTVGRGCGMELGKYLNPGDLVELEIAGIGVLRNRIGMPPTSGWLPTPKQATMTV